LRCVACVSRNFTDVLKWWCRFWCFPLQPACQQRVPQDRALHQEPRRRVRGSRDPRAAPSACARPSEAAPARGMSAGKNIQKKSNQVFAPRNNNTQKCSSIIFKTKSVILSMSGCMSSSNHSRLLSIPRSKKVAPLFPIRCCVLPSSSTPLITPENSTFSN